MDILRHIDDMGRTPVMTQRISRAWRDGFVDSVSVMGNGEGLGYLGLGQTNRPLRLAVHLNLSEGRSVADPATVPLLVDDQGQLCQTFGSLMMAQVQHRQALVEQVEREWRGQIECVLGAVGGRPVAAVDGHVHVHMLPALFPIAARLASEFGIPGIRVSAEPFHVSDRLADSVAVGFGVNIVKHVVLRALSVRARAVAREHGLEPSDGFVGVLYTGRMTAAAARAGVRAAQRRGAERVEVLFHIAQGTSEREFDELVGFSKSLR